MLLYPYEMVELLNITRFLCSSLRMYKIKPCSLYGLKYSYSYCLFFPDSFFKHNALLFESAIWRLLVSAVYLFRLLND